MTGRLEGKVAIVTGGSSGIGRCIVEKFAKEGCAAVGIFDIDEPGAKETISLIGKTSTKLFSYKVDVASYENCKAATESFLKDAGVAPTILVNNVGWDLPNWFMDTEPSFWRKIVDINLIGVYNMCHVVLKHMIPLNKGGRVINVASDAGRLGAGHEAVYSGAKAGAMGFTKALAREMARHNILVNTVSPGSTNTAGYRNVKDKTVDPARFEQKMIQQTPLRRLGEPMEVANMIAFLASDEASWIDGQTISASGGLTMVG